MIIIIKLKKFIKDLLILLLIIMHLTSFKIKLNLFEILADKKNHIYTINIK
jgi:hypothetical protein